MYNTFILRDTEAVIFIISGVNYMYNIFILRDTEAVIFIISVIQMRTTGIN